MKINILILKALRTFILKCFNFGIPWHVYSDSSLIYNNNECLKFLSVPAIYNVFISPKKCKKNLP